MTTSDAKDIKNAPAARDTRAHERAVTGDTTPAELARRDERKRLERAAKTDPMAKRQLEALARTEHFMGRGGSGSDSYEVRTNDGSTYRKNGEEFGPAWREVDSSGWTEEQHRNLLMSPILEVDVGGGRKSGKPDEK